MQELQRRLDQTLGKPGSYLAEFDRSGNVQQMTIGARLCRVENQVFNIIYLFGKNNCLRLTKCFTAIKIIKYAELLKKKRNSNYYVVC